jgi:6,7-dimethyl-8-ribityllumazine synthase
MVPKKHRKQEREVKMPKTIEGKIDGRGLRIGIVVSRFNDFITSRLLEGALDALARHGVADEDVVVVKVPGSLELTYAARRLQEEGKLAAVICLGAVIRGDTPHFEYVSSTVTRDIARLTMESEIPVINGVLTTDNVDQAIERAGTKAGNKGFSAAQGAIEMADLAGRIRKLGTHGPKKKS